MAHSWWRVMTDVSGRVFFGWWVVLAAAIGLATGIASVNLWTFGIFLKHLTGEFDWSRTEVSIVLLIGTIVTVLISPWIGRVVDRFGARRVALPSIVLLALTLASLYWLTPSLLHLYVVFALMPIVGGGTSSVLFSRVVTFWFDRRRGFALGLALTGVGIGAFVLPLYAQALIDAFGWRLAYVGLGVLMLGVTLPVVALLLRDSPQTMGLLPDGAGHAPGASRASGPVPGYSIDLARKQPRFWIMAATFCLVGFGLTGPMLHLVPMLTDRGVSPELAAVAQAVIGLSLIFGRVLAGWLMDRFFAPHVAIAFLLGPVIGIYVLASGATGWMAFASAALIGLAAGAEVDVIAYLSSRYFGMRAFGETYGWQYAAFTAGSGLAPAVTAAGFDQTGSYSSILIVLGSLLLVAIGLLTRLGPYPNWNFGSAVAATSRTAEEPG
ncbi:MAG TPA: MFS transporter [Steroidobacteraceae bacterium]|nr:MFS transporter [Steroidobacteraceae bacterium]